MGGKICMVTGANSGIGKAIALGLAQLSATVVMVSRDRARGEAARDETRAKSGNTNIDLLLASLSSQQSIYQLAEQYRQRYTHLQVLINNAGTFNLSRSVTIDGMEKTFAVIQLAPFLLTNLLLDVIMASTPACIVNVSSGSHEAGYIKLQDLQLEQGYRPMRTYGQSKLAVYLFSYELAHQLSGTGVTINCLHPGLVATYIVRGNLLSVLRAVTKFILSIFGISLQKGTKISIYLACSLEIECITGKYFVKSIPKRSAQISYETSL